MGEAFQLGVSSVSTVGTQWTRCSRSTVILAVLWDSRRCAYRKLKGVNDRNNAVVSSLKAVESAPSDRTHSRVQLKWNACYNSHEKVAGKIGKRSRRPDIK